MKNIISKLSIADEGNVFVLGKSIYKDNWTNKEIGFCPSEIKMMDELSVKDFILAYNSYRGLNTNFVTSTIKKIFDESFLEKKIKFLSTGWKKIVQIFTIIISNPKIFLLDEPFNGLDPKMRRKFIESLIEMKKNKKTVLISTHILSDLEEIADDITIIKYGTVVYSGKKPKNIQETYDMFFEEEQTENLLWNHFNDIITKEE